MTSPARLLIRQTRPEDADAAYRAGVTAIRQGCADEAIPLMQAAARRHPKDARMWQVLGLACRDQEDLGPAVEALAEAARLAPQDPLIAHTFARATMEAGLPAAALFDRALALTPDDPSVLLGRTAALFAEGRGSEAVAGLDEKLRLAPGWLLGHVTLCRLRWMCGDQEDFTASLERALAAVPREVALWQQLAAVLMESRLYERAIAVLVRARAAAGDSVHFDWAEAACRTEQGDVVGADPLFARLGTPAGPAQTDSLIRHLLRAGRPQAAAETAEQHLADQGGYMFWPYLAVAWRMTGDPRWNWLEGDPRFVGVYDIADRVGPLDALAARLRTLHLASNQPLEQSVRGGTQTDGPLFARVEPEIRRLRQAIVEAVQRHVAQLPPVDPRHPLLGAPRDAPVRFSGSWSVRLGGRGHHANHVHPAGWLSSAFYVALPETSSGGDGHGGWLTLGEGGELGLDLPPLRLVEPKPGRLVLFPSTMWHGTRPFDAGERLTVAFDVARPLQ